jgi:hypothetical protein
LLVDLGSEQSRRSAVVCRIQAYPAIIKQAPVSIRRRRIARILQLLGHPVVDHP